MNAVRHVVHPEVCAKCFKNSNTINIHNQSRQHDIKLEKHWVTQSRHFQIATKLVGMTVADCWRAHHAHLPHGHRHASLGITEFTSILAKDCLENEFSNERPSDAMVNIGEEEDPI